MDRKSPNYATLNNFLDHSDSAQSTDETPLGTRVDRIVNHALASHVEIATRVVLDT